MCVLFYRVTVQIKWDNLKELFGNLCEDPAWQSQKEKAA